MEDEILEAALWGLVSACLISLALLALFVWYLRRFGLPEVVSQNMASESEKSGHRKSFEARLHDVLPGLVSSVGWWRLSIAAGAAIAAPWIVFVLYMWGTRGGPRTPDAMGWLVGLTSASFLLPWGIVQAVGWVVEGFKQKSD